MIERISPEEAKKRLDAGWIYLDVRSVPEFEQGHPAGAYNVPLMHMGRTGMVPNAEFVGTVMAAFPKTAKLIVGCKSGGRSLKAAEMLKAAGYAAVADQRAGWGGARDAFGQLSERGWQASGLPCATSAVPGHAWDDLAKVGT